MRININAAAFLLIAGFIVSFCFPKISHADSDKQEYQRARAHFDQFLKNDEKWKYRDNWLACIQKFQSAYRSNPTGDYAAANLYMAGKIYQDLYALSRQSTDRKESVDLFNRLINRHPKSRYRSKARAALKKFEPDNVAPQMQAEETTTASDTRQSGAADLKQRDPYFVRAKAAYKSSLADPVIAEKDSGDEAAKTQAALHQDGDPISRLIIIEETCDPAAFARSSGKSAPAAEAVATISGLRYWSNPNYTRIVIDGDRETSYTPKLLKQDLAASRPQRLYIDFDNSRLAGNVKKAMPIDDDLLIGARAGQCKPGTVRIVIDIKSFQSYKIFSLNNPFRTIIDVWGKEPEILQADASKPLKTSRTSKKTSMHPKPHVYEAAVRDDPGITPNDLAKQLALGVHKIVIDAGHGGHDGGAPGYVKGVREKDVVLSIARRLAKRIREDLGCEVIMTRNSDRFLSLEERTAIANTKNADLFISIHCNASKSTRAYGIETYYLNLATDDDAILVAARENATSRKSISDLQSILNDLMQNSKINESSRLATYVQNSLHGHMKQNYSYAGNKGVKQAPFYVLLGAQMPSILVETSFISNERECKRLINGNYQEDLCKAITKGLKGYMEETNPTAFWNTGSRKKS